MQPVVAGPQDEETAGGIPVADEMGRGVRGGQGVGRAGLGDRGGEQGDSADTRAQRGHDDQIQQIEPPGDSAEPLARPVIRYLLIVPAGYDKFGRQFCPLGQKRLAR